MKTRVRNKKDYQRKRRHMHVRNRVAGTSERPRVCVFRSNAHIYAQIIDDDEGKTLALVSSLKVDASKPAEPAAVDEDKANDAGDKKKKKKGGKKAKPEGAKILQARAVGRLVANVAKDKGITKIRFDRGGYLYHGRVAALADEMRKNGLEF
jgi:large subunit ribosomal protein L18